MLMTAKQYVLIINEYGLISDMCLTTHEYVREADHCQLTLYRHPTNYFGSMPLDPIMYHHMSLHYPLLLAYIMFTLLL